MLLCRIIAGNYHCWMEARASRCTQRSGPMGAHATRPMVQPHGTPLGRSNKLKNR